MAIEGTTGKFGDYEYIYDALLDYPEALEHIMQKLDGLQIRIKLHEHKRFAVQKKLLSGVSPQQIAIDLEMKLKVVQNIKYRMQNAILKGHTDET